MKHHITNTLNDNPVYVDLIQSDAAKHIAQQPQLLRLAAEALQKRSLRGKRIVIEHNLGRAIGYNFIVPTNDKSAIFYARTLRDKLYTRFVKNTPPLATAYITMTLDGDEQGAFELRDIWIGRIVPPRPGSIDATPESVAYWARHAYIFDKQSLQAHTLTKTVPNFNL